MNNGPDRPRGIDALAAARMLLARASREAAAQDAALLETLHALSERGQLTTEDATELRTLTMNLQRRHTRRPCSAPQLRA